MHELVLAANVNSQHPVADNSEITGSEFPVCECTDRRQLFAKRWPENAAVSYHDALKASLIGDITPEPHRIRQTLLVIAEREDYTPMARKE